jgi:hypothetical protein
MYVWADLNAILEIIVSMLELLIKFEHNVDCQLKYVIKIKFRIKLLKTYSSLQSPSIHLNIFNWEYIYWWNGMLKYNIIIKMRFLRKPEDELCCLEC